MQKNSLKTRRKIPIFAITKFNPFYPEVLKFIKVVTLAICLKKLLSTKIQSSKKKKFWARWTRYQRDAMEGAARNNLKLLAKTIKGMAKNNQLIAPNFLRYASILSVLTDDEIYVLGVMVREAKSTTENIFPDASGVDTVTSYSAMNPGKNTLAGKYDHVQQALVRTGLVQMHSKGMTSYQDQTTMNYSLTPLMVELLKYTEGFF